MSVKAWLLPESLVHSLLISPAPADIVCRLFRRILYVHAAAG